MKKPKRKRLMNIQTAIFVLMILVPVLTLILIKGNLSSAGDVLTITAKYITKEPNGVDDPVWQQAQSVQVSVEGREVISREKGTVNGRIPHGVSSNNPGRLMGKSGLIWKATKIGLRCFLRSPELTNSLLEDVQSPATVRRICRNRNGNWRRIPRQKKAISGTGKPPVPLHTAMPMMPG